MIIHFAKASISPSSRYSTVFILFFKIILVENSGKELNQFSPSNNSDDLCVLFCLYASSICPTIL